MASCADPVLVPNRQGVLAVALIRHQPMPFTLNGDGYLTLIYSPQFRNAAPNDQIGSIVRLQV
jgi:hypothetical protein